MKLGKTDAEPVQITHGFGWVDRFQSFSVPIKLSGWGSEDKRWKSYLFIVIMLDEYIVDRGWLSTSGIFKLCYPSVSSLFVSVTSSISSSSFYKLCANKRVSNFQVRHMPQKFEFNLGSSRQAWYLAQHIFAWSNSLQSVTNQVHSRPAGSLYTTRLSL